MKVEFEKPVTFSTLHRAFTGEGIPPIPEDAKRVAVSSRTTAYLSTTGEAWECFAGNGTSLSSQTFYWPALDLCPRAWAQEKEAANAS